jgi:hypothetical protein
MNLYTSLYLQVYLEYITCTLPIDYRWITAILPTLLTRKLLSLIIKCIDKVSTFDRQKADILRRSSEYVDVLSSAQLRG